ncbi:MAG: S-layer homology domain-containing protein [Candidatus Wallbacteria bacterium]|nr:S-layer homology domain-containing protein [Candidatus Wallbacteria bacterium]
MKRFTKSMIVAFAMSMATPAFAANPFSDVPKDHWAYKAVERSLEAGIMSTHDSKFGGGKTVTRYQMAVIVARMLDKMGSGGGKHSKKDIQNLEALVIEFADELALLNVKVSSLEEGLADMKKDVDGLKKDYAAGGAKAGISGLLQGRLVMTGEDPTGAQGRGAAPAATGPIQRYIGRVPNGGAGKGSDRTFFNMAQTSVSFDRHFDDDYYLHLQMDFDADQDSAFASGNNVQINEAYVDMERWLLDGDVRVKVGTFALPFSRERNPEMVDYPNQLRFGSRSLDLTISPSFQDATWEAVRNVGASLWQPKDSCFQWQVGATSSPFVGSTRDGSLLAWRQLSGGAAALGRAVYGDSPQSIDNNGTGAAIQDSIGAFAWAGDKYNGGFRWDAGYFTSGSDLRTDAVASNSWQGVQFNAGWWGWEDWGFMGSYFQATNDSATATVGAARVGFGAAGYSAGLYPALLATESYPSVESRAYSLLVNYRFSDDNNASVRYEDLSDEFGVAEITGKVLTVGWNHHVSSNSMLQLEYSTPETKARGGVRNAAGAIVAGATNNVDVDDDLVQLNYKVRF